MEADYIIIKIKIQEEKYELVFAALSDFEFLGIEEKKDELAVTFRSSYWNDEIMEQVNEALLEYNLEYELSVADSIIEKNWNEEWEKHLEPIIVSDRLAITPSWKKNELTHPILIEINPKMSFGTGHHATTRLMCKLLEKNIKAGSKWVDAGTGTGVLAIAAVKLGAKSCFAFDNNKWSVENAAENFELNRCADKIELHELDIDEIKIPECDGIAANLFINLVLPSFPKFNNALKPDGNLLISGIMIYDRDAVESEAKKNGFYLDEFVTEDEWIAFNFKKIKE